MKKVVKIAAIVVAVIIVLLIALPFMFRGKIAELVKTEGNKMLNAEFDFASLDISLIRHFPQASLSLEDFWLKGKGDFANDTLVQAGEVTATVNLLSLFGNSGYDISRIYIDDTRLHAIVLEDGRANWDIMKADSTTTDTAATEEGSGNFRIKLQIVLNQHIIPVNPQKSRLRSRFVHRPIQGNYRHHEDGLHWLPAQ